MQHDHVLIKLNFDLCISPPRVGVVAGGMRVKHLLPCCCLNDSHFDMQHDHVLKKWILTPPLRVGVRGGIYWQNVRYHDDAFVIPLNLICNMTML